MENKLPVIDLATAGVLGLPSSNGNSVVIVTFNNEGCIDECLQSVLPSLRDGDEVIVVDNGSADRTVEIVRQRQAQSGQLRLIEAGVNLGYSGGCNVGMKGSSGEFIVLLNPDTVVYPRWLEKLRRGFTSEVGAVAPSSDNVAGAQFIGHRIEPGFRLSEIQDLLTERFAGQLVETKLLIGFCLMLRRELLDRIGLLDEDLFLGNDDLELSWRIRSHGLKLFVALDVFVHHRRHVSFDSLSSSKVDELLHESGVALRAKLEAHYGVVPSYEELWGLTLA